MKKSIVLIVILFIVSASNSYSQSFADRIHFEASAGAGAKYQCMRPMDITFKVNVDIVKKLYAYIAEENNHNLYKDGDFKTYYDSANLGGGLGVKLLDNDNTIHKLDLRAGVLSSLGNADWKHTTYGVGLAWYLGPKSRAFSPVVEMGYRYADTHTEGMKNYSGFYMSIGLRY